MRGAQEASSSTFVRQERKTNMTEITTLERKPLSDLHQIAAQLGIEGYRKYRKPALAELIYKTATEQAAGQQPATNGETATHEVTANGDATNTQESVQTQSVQTQSVQTRVDPFGEADTAL